MTGITSSIDIEKSIQDYIETHPDSESEKLSEFGVSKEGRLVKLASLESGHRSFKDQLNSTLEDRRDSLILSRGCTLSEARIRLENKDSTSRLVKDRLDALKEKYSKEYRRIHEVMDTKTVKFDDELACITETPMEKRDEFGYSFFANTYTPEQWTFYSNKKSIRFDKKEFFMSNVAAIQFEKTFAEKGWLLELPKKIKRSNIENKVADNLIQSYIGRHESEEFMKDYLRNTVNGKSTVQIAQDFDLEVYKLSVSLGYLDRDQKEIDANPELPKKYYDVFAYVRPLL